MAAPRHVPRIPNVLLEIRGPFSCVGSYGRAGCWVEVVEELEDVGDVEWLGEVDAGAEPVQVDNLGGTGVGAEDDNGQGGGVAVCS